MSNGNGTIWVTYNGAIYNYREVRQELEGAGHRFVSRTDTEVIIQAYEKWGIECLHRFNGMWAFCLWDGARKQIFCARDRLGVKPLYYRFDGKVFAFASEIKALLELGFRREANESLIHDFLRFGILDHTDETFFDGVMKLPAAHYLFMDGKGRLAIHRYWDLTVSDKVESAYRDDKYAEEFRDLFTDAVRLRLRSDVPIGSCLSGGLDSSSVVCVANRLLFPNGNGTAQERQKTFSSCFAEKRFDERDYIEQVIERTHVEKNYVFPSAEEFMGDLDRIIWHQEEPFAGSSIYAQWAVMKRAHERDVTVMLDGQGGDEQLGGYRKFYIFYLLKLLRSRRIARLAIESLGFFSSSDVLKTLNIRLGLGYLGLDARLLGVHELLREPFRERFSERELGFGYQEDLGQRIREDIVKFSLPVLLRYEDKNAMAHCVETRLPFLDYRLVELLASFPLTQKMHKGWTKYVLRRAMKGVLPPRVLYRKTKLGFDTPEDQWFRQFLRPTVRDVFRHASFLQQYADLGRLRQIFDRFSSGLSLCPSRFLFRFFIVELWAKKFLYPSSTSEVKEVR
jgi:asparagine synthase (glutamine-hydrolysing)